MVWVTVVYDPQLLVTILRYEGSSLALEVGIVVPEDPVAAFGRSGANLVSFNINCQFR